MDDQPAADIPPLLAPDEPPAAERLNPAGACDLVLLCDHASNRVPRALGGLGLAPEHFHRHIAYDIGAEGVTRLLVRGLDATAVIAGYSRLVVDLNRPPGHPGSMPDFSDATDVPGNGNLRLADVTARLEAFFEPYHKLVRQTLADVWIRRRPPAILSVHSFSPRFGGSPRSWDVGVLWNHDPRLARPLIKALHDRGLDVGDNLPYSGRDVSYTIDAHGAASGLANCVIEINQDQVGDDAGIARWAGILLDVLPPIIADEGLYRVEFH